MPQAENPRQCWTITLNGKTSFNTALTHMMDSRITPLISISVILRYALFNNLELYHILLNTHVQGGSATER